jgi:hypothetical protein
MTPRGVTVELPRDKWSQQAATTAGYVGILSQLLMQESSAEDVSRA